MKTLVPALIAAAVLSGCAGPMTVGVPGSQREAAPEAPLKYSTSGEPAFCVASVVGPFAYRIGHYVDFASKTPFRDIRLLTNNHPGPQGCDILLKLNSPGRAAWSLSNVEAYSARTRELLWEGSARGKVASAGGLGVLGPAVHRAFQPGQPAYDLFQAAKDKGQAPTIEDLEAFASSGLISEADWYGTQWYSWVRVGKARPVEQAVAAVPVPVETRPVSDVDEAPAPRASRRGHAVIVGVESYRGRLPRADFAAADARTMARYAHAALGYPEENIALLTDDGASKSDFEKHFERWLSNRVEKDDEVFVYFSGHGAPYPQTGDAYLVPYDGDPMYLAETGYSIKRLYEALAKLPAKKVTVALDSCFSGAGGRSVIAKGARPLVAVQAVEAPANVTVISASSGGQISNSFDEKGHGLFTYFFLKGLKERGSDLKAAFDFAKPEVAKVARRQFNADQEPPWSEGR